MVSGWTLLSELLDPHQIICVCIGTYIINCVLLSHRMSYHHTVCWQRSLLLQCTQSHQRFDIPYSILCNIRYLLHITIASGGSRVGNLDSQACFAISTQSLNQQSTLTLNFDEPHSEISRFAPDSDPLPFSRSPSSTSCTLFLSSLALSTSAPCFLPLLPTPLLACLFQSFPMPPPLPLCLLSL